MREGVAEALEQRLEGRARIHTDPSLLEVYTRDQARLPRSFSKMIKAPVVVVQPETTDAVVDAVQWCDENDVPLVPRGAGSSAFGGSLATMAAVTLDLRRLDRLRSVDDTTAWVEAGLTWNRLATQLEPHGRATRVHTTSRFSTVGGMIATGGFGLGSTRYGHVRYNVEELEVVTREGVQTLDATEASDQFLTDGQLGIITAARLKTRARPAHAATVVALADSYGQAISRARELAEAPGIYTVLAYDKARVHEINRVMGSGHIPERHLVVARFEDDQPIDAPASDVEPYVAGLVWQQRHFPMRPLKMGPGLLGVELVFPDGAAAGFADWAGRRLRRFNLDAANEAYVLPDGRLLNITTYLTDASSPSYAAHVAQVARLTRGALTRGGTPYGGGLWNLPVMVARHGRARLRELQATKRRIDPKNVINPGKSLAPPKRTSMVGLLLRTPAARIGPWLAAFGSPFLQYRPRATSTPPVAIGANGTGAAFNASAAGCVQCGACVPVCPAFQHTGDERTTARGKLLFMDFLAHGGQPTADEAATLYQCIRCRACEEVCQTDLPLLAAFDDLEGDLTKRFGFPKAKIQSFLSGYEQDPRAQEVIDETRAVFRAKDKDAHPIPGRVRLG